MRVPETKGEAGPADMLRAKWSYSKDSKDSKNIVLNTDLSM